MQAAPQRPEPRDAGEFGQVVPFPLHRVQRGAPRLPASPAQLLEDTAPDLADDDFARYEAEREEPVNERQRMLMNVIALAIVMALMGAGLWIADTITDMERDQDCVLQGRVNCAPIARAPEINRD